MGEKLDPEESAEILDGGIYVGADVHGTEVHKKEKNKVVIRSAKKLLSSSSEAARGNHKAAQDLW